MVIWKVSSYPDFQKSILIQVWSVCDFPKNSMGLEEVPNHLEWIYSKPNVGINVPYMEHMGLWNLWNLYCFVSISSVGCDRWWNACCFLYVDVWCQMTTLQPQRLRICFVQLFDSNYFTDVSNMGTEMFVIDRCTTQQIGSQNIWYPLPETNIQPQKCRGWKIDFLLRWPVFRGYVSFRECIRCIFSRISECFSTRNLERGMLRRFCHDVSVYVLGCPTSQHYTKHHHFVF